MLHGEHIKGFIEKLTSKVVDFLLKLDNMRVTKELITLLISCQELSRTISKTTYKNEEEYEQFLINFKVNVQLFKSAAKQIFYASQSGDDIDATCKNFYCHVLTDYMEYFMQQTYDIYGLGTGIFFMQGFEHQNKESKNCAKQFYNNKFNITISTLLQLYDLFFS